MSTSITVSVSELLLDTENFRLGSQKDQQSVIQAMLEDQGDKLINLALHIAENGLNPLENTAVIPYGSREEGEEKYTVVEGNRRLLAIKVLSQPDLLDGTALQKQKKKLLNAIDEFNPEPIDELNCELFSDREDAIIWMRLKHTGENEGRGTVDWSAAAQSRLENIAGGKNVNNSALAILDFLNRNGANIPQNYPITNLQRLLNTPAVRKLLGLISINPLKSDCSPNELLSRMVQVCRDLGQPGAVNSIRNRSDRLDYINSLGFSGYDPIPEWNVEDYTPDAAQPAPSIGTVSSSPKTHPSDGSSRSSSRTRPLSSKRGKLIPSQFCLSIPNPRINAIFRELKRLKISDFPNACAVLFRVFLELSVDDYIGREKINSTASDTLTKKINAVRDHMVQQKILSQKEAQPIGTMTSNRDCFFGIPSLNAYVHNPKAIVLTPEFLANAWDRIEHFIRKLWP